MFHRTALVSFLAILACLVGCSRDPVPRSLSAPRDLASPTGQADRALPRPPPGLEPTVAVAAPADPSSPSMDPTMPAAERHGAADPDLPTADEQSMAPEDVETTRLIRQAVVDDAALSMGARNVVIVTREHVVTLRGDVGTDDERDIIERHARGVSGVSRVENRITVRL